MKVRSIEKIRELKDLSAESVATELGLSERQYRRYEAGETGWTLQLLESVAKLFKMTVPEMLSFDEKMFFQQCTGLVGLNTNNTYNAPGEKEREQYEARIKELHERIAELKLDIAELRKEKALLRSEIQKGKG